MNETCYENATGHTTKEMTISWSTTTSNESSHSDLKRRVATLAKEDVSNTFVYPTGMASITAAHRLLKLTSNWNETPLRNIVFGFPYLDTLKLNSRRELGGGTWCWCSSVVFERWCSSAGVRARSARILILFLKYHEYHCVTPAYRRIFTKA